MSTMFLNNYPDLFGRTQLPALQALIFRKYQAVPRQYSMFFNVKTSNRELEQTTQLSGLGLLQHIGDNDPVPYDSMVPGFDATYEHAMYAGGFKATKVLIMNDRNGLLAKAATDMGHSARETVELIAANYINSNPTGPDGVSLFSASHPLIKAGGVQSNIMGATTDFSPVSVQLALTRYRKMVDSSGRKIRIRPAMAVVPTEMEFVAAEVLNGAMRSDTANHTVNALRHRDGHASFTQSVVWDYLTDPLKWYLWSAKDDHELRFYWREKPNVDSWRDPETRGYSTGMWMQLSVGHSDYGGVFGCF